MTGPCSPALWWTHNTLYTHQKGRVKQNTRIDFVDVGLNVGKKLQKA